MWALKWGKREQKFFLHNPSKVFSTLYFEEKQKREVENIWWVKKTSERDSVQWFT